MNLIMSDKDINIVENRNTKYIDLSKLKINNCIGCFGCWTKTPGKCVIRDDAVKVYPYIAKSDKVLYVSRVKYGGYDSVFKTMVERAIPVQQAFIRIHNGETHHLQRNVKEKDATIIAYGNISDEEKKVFERLISRNAQNMNFKSYKILFIEDNMVETEVKKILEQWEK